MYSFLYKQIKWIFYFILSEAYRSYNFLHVVQLNGFIQNLITFFKTTLRIFVSIHTCLTVKAPTLCFLCLLGVIYLKNMITQHWSDGDGSTETPVKNIPEEDRQFIRDNIVEAIIHSPERIR